jgi:hypothetical protein
MKEMLILFIDRDFVSREKTEAPSQGFGFVDFENHLHALARELNNNPKYSDEFVTGGKHASRSRRAVKRNKKVRGHKNRAILWVKTSKAKLPRLVVEFAVENVVKANSRRNTVLISSLILSSKRHARSRKEETGKAEGVSSSVRKTETTQKVVRMRQDKR